jgi:FemAB-related protein (PEP-CTERM system-associated)
MIQSPPSSIRADAHDSRWTEPAVRVTVRRDGDWDLRAHGLPVAGGYGTDPRWLPALRDGLRQRPLRIEAACDGRLEGILPLALVESRLFGRFLVSLPYVNTAGVAGVGAKRNPGEPTYRGFPAVQPRPPVAQALIDRAVELADEFDVRYLELRQETAIEHSALTFQRTDKVHMRLNLPESVEELRTALKAGVRNQVKKGESHGLEVQWGRDDLLRDFYRVFSRNMRDLGTPVFGRELFAAILRSFGDDAELCVVRQDGRPIAAALVIHAGGVTQVPSASSLRAFNHLNANMLMYWRLLLRAVDRGSRVFDFGRSSEGSGTYKFKKQWGARPFPSVWQYYVRRGDTDAMRPESARNQRLIRLWKRLPVWCANAIGPRIVRGIP